MSPVKYPCAQFISPEILVHTKQWLTLHTYARLRQDETSVAWKGKPCSIPAGKRPSVCGWAQRSERFATTVPQSEAFLVMLSAELRLPQML